MGSLGDNDEDEAEKQSAAREPKIQRGTVRGRRDELDAKPLVSIDALAPGLGLTRLWVPKSEAPMTKSLARSETWCSGPRTAEIMRL